MKLVDEIYKIGIKNDNSIIHFGAGHKNGEFILDLNTYLNKNSMSVNYVGVESENSKIESTIDFLVKNDVQKQYQNILNATMQDYAVNNNETYDFAIITGIFDKPKYGDQQLHFIHSTINELFRFTENSIIFTYNSSENTDQMYDLYYMSNYVHSNYSRFSAIRINEHEYLYCINKYYLSYNI
jgi:hypothetical protein